MAQEQQSAVTPPEKPVTSTVSQSAGSKGRAAPSRYRIRAKDREYLTSNLALLVKSSMPLGEILSSLQESAPSRNLKQALGQMRADIDEGIPLWQALERTGAVSRQTLELVRLGERSGRLADNLRVAAKQEYKQRVFRSKVRSALIYPTFVLGITVIVAVGVAWFLLPRLADTFSGLGVELPLVSKLLINTGLFLKENGLWFVPSFITAFVLGGYLLFAAPKTRALGQRMLFFVPGVSGLLRQVEVARFGYLLGMLLQAGLPVTKALQMVHEATAAAQYKKFYAYLRQSLEEGYSFAAAMSGYKKAGVLVPPAVQQMVIAGERSGSLPETLSSVGTIYEEKADAAVQNLEAILEPVLLIIVWLGVMGVAIAVILPIYGLLGGLGG